MNQGKMKFTLIFVAIGIVIISVIGFWIANKQTANNQQSTTQPKPYTPTTQEQVNNQTTVDAIEQDITTTNLDTELPSDDLEQVVNTLL